MSNYKTIIEKSFSVYKEKGSKFFAYSFYCNCKNSFNQELEVIKKKHSSARHFCYAYRFGSDKKEYRMNDDGEPSKSAGAPIFRQIKSFDLTNIAIVVVRYFGGTKLGISGLINAYKEASRLSIHNNKIIEKEDEIVLTLQFEYEVMPFIMNQLKKNKITILKQVLENTVFIQVSIPIRIKDDFVNQFINYNIKFSPTLNA